jgi:hypothetical protein
MFDHLNVALERINYQPQSPFAKELVELFTEAFKYVDETAPKKIKFTDRESIKWKNQLVLKFNRETGLTGNLRKIINKHTNLTVKACSIQVFGQINAYMIPRFKVSDKEVLSAFNRVTGKAQKEYTAKDIPDILKTAQSKFDPTNGNFNKSISEVYAFDLSLAIELFTTKHLMLSDSHVSPEMLTAVVLHEIGHAVTMPELLGNAFYRATEAADSLKALATTAKVVDANEFIAQARDAVDLLTDEKQKKDFISLIDKASSGSPEKKIPVAMAVVGSVVHQAIFDISRMIIDFASREFLKSRADVTFRNYNVKTSDTVFTQRNSSVIERVADEYVSRHGMSQYLAQMVPLFVRLRPKYWGGPIVNGVIRVVAGTLDILNAVAYPPMITPHATTYDTDLERIENILSNIYAGFKNQNLPNEVYASLITEVEETKLAIVKLKKIYSFKINNFIWKTLLKLVEPGSLAGMVRDANMAADYEKLQKISKGMIRSPLYYQAARVRAIIET